MVNINVILTEQVLAADFLKALTARSLPEKYFYWFPLSVKGWLALCRDGQYRNFIRSMDLIKRQASDIVSHIDPRELMVMSLGSGQGDKDLYILEALKAAGHRLIYFPVDSSQSLLEMAVGRALKAKFPCEGIKIDLNNWDHLMTLRTVKLEHLIMLHPDEPMSPLFRLYLLLGNTLGAFDPLEYCRQLRRLLTPGDYLLVDCELYSSENTMAGYDNPENRRFAWAPLKSIGISETDGDLIFELRQDDRLPGLHLIAKHFSPTRDLELTVAGQPLRLSHGQRLEMNFSYKYSREGFLDLLTGPGGFRVLSEYLSDDQQFLMVLTEPAA